MINKRLMHKWLLGDLYVFSILIMKMKTEFFYHLQFFIDT
jgi:hypothetical protein